MPIQSNNPPQTPVVPSFKVLAYAIILLRKEGHPCVFYGDLYGIRANVKELMTPSCNGNLPLLTQARKLYAYGEQQDYFNQPNCIGSSPPFTSFQLAVLFISSILGHEDGPDNPALASLTTPQDSSATVTPVIHLVLLAC
jgi:hypothetical protein